jgi:TrpR-related protein YerC/YecD
MRENYPDKDDKLLIEALLKLESDQEFRRFLRDLFTLSELKEAAKRFKIATLLWTTDKPYLEIADEVGTSTTTVTRVADFLYKKGLNGYQTVLKRLYPNQKTER